MEKNCVHFPPVVLVERLVCFINDRVADVRLMLYFCSALWSKFTQTFSIGYFLQKRLECKVGVYCVSHIVQCEDSLLIKTSLYFAFILTKLFLTKVFIQCILFWNKFGPQISTFLST